MEQAAAASASSSGNRASHSQCEGSLSRKPSSSSSFRLRCPSLNSLRLRRMFDIFDKNGDSMITVQEINLALTRLGLEADLSQLESTIQTFIKPGNIGLTYDDFVALHQSLDESFFALELESEGTTEEEAVEGEDAELKMSQEESDLSEAFKIFDEDEDGFISAQDLQMVLGKLGLPEGREIDRVQQMIFSVDQNHDGRVDFFEFKHMMQSGLARSS